MLMVLDFNSSHYLHESKNDEEEYYIVLLMGYAADGR